VPSAPLKEGRSSRPWLRPACSRRDWGGLLTELEGAAADPGVALLELEQDASSGSLRLAGEARTLSEVFAFLTRLEAGGRVRHAASSTTAFVPRTGPGAWFFSLPPAGRPGREPCCPPGADRVARLRESAGGAFALGPVGVAGITLALFAVSFDLSGNRALLAEAEGLQQETRALHRRLRQPVPVAVPERRRLGTSTPAFPRRRPCQACWSGSWSCPGPGLEVDKAEYRSAVDAGSPLERISLELPARAPWRAAGVDRDVLAGMPEVALEHLALQRPAMDVAVVEARVRFVIFVRRGP
jgi:hypothetical protein